MANILETSLPEILTKRRIMLTGAFLMFFLEDYLRFNGHDLTWFTQALPTISILDVFQFLSVLFVCWLGMLPILYVIFNIICIQIGYALQREAKAPTYRTDYLTGNQLLSQALARQDLVAYQCFKRHSKQVKKRQVIRELCFYIFVTVCINLCLSNSLMQHGFFWCAGRFPVGVIVVPLLIIVLFVQGVIQAAFNDDEWTTVWASKPENSRLTGPPKLSA